MFKKWTILMVFVLGAVLVHAQSPEKIYPFSQKQEDMAWYKQQAKAWKAVTEKDPGNAAAWFNLYYAKRIILFHDVDGRGDGQALQDEISGLIKDMDQNIPGTYELNLVKWMAGGLDMKNLPYLMKANELGPDRTDHLDHMINVSELLGKKQDKMLYARKKFKAGQVSPGMLYYNYNVLSGLDSNAILLSFGDNDTYPAWTLQALGTRKDVQVLNLSLLLVDDYRKSVFNELGAEPVSMDWEKYSANPAKEENEFRKNVLRSLTKNRKGRPVYIALTASTLIDSFADMQRNFYMTGLAYQYSNTPIDNIAVLKRNFEQLYALDYLDKPMYIDGSEALVKRINANYVVPMIRLFDHYKQSGDLVRKQWIKEKLEAVSAASEDEADIKKHISR